MEGRRRAGAAGQQQPHGSGLRRHPGWLAHRILEDKTQTIRSEQHVHFFLPEAEISRPRLGILRRPSAVRPASWQRGGRGPSACSCASPRPTRRRPRPRAAYSATSASTSRIIRPSWRGRVSIKLDQPVARQAGANTITTIAILGAPASGSSSAPRWDRRCNKTARVGAGCVFLFGTCSRFEPRTAIPQPSTSQLISTPWDVIMGHGRRFGEAAGLDPDHYEVCPRSCF